MKKALELIETGVAFRIAHTVIQSHPSLATYWPSDTLIPPIPWLPPLPTSVAENSSTSPDLSSSATLSSSLSISSLSLSNLTSPTLASQYWRSILTRAFHQFITKCSGTNESDKTTHNPTSLPSPVAAPPSSSSSSSYDFLHPSPFSTAVCLGVGRISRSPTAQYQLAAFLTLLVYFNITSTHLPTNSLSPSSASTSACSSSPHFLPRVEVYDPVFATIDRTLVYSWFGLALPSKNHEAKRCVALCQSTTSSPTHSTPNSLTTCPPLDLALVYLPHCGIGLTSNTIWGLWRLTSLPASVHSTEVTASSSTTLASSSSPSSSTPLSPSIFSPLSRLVLLSNSISKALSGLKLDSGSASSRLGLSQILNQEDLRKELGQASSLQPESLQSIATLSDSRVYLASLKVLGTPIPSISPRTTNESMNNPAHQEITDQAWVSTARVEPWTHEVALSLKNPKPTDASTNVTNASGSQGGDDGGGLFRVYSTNKRNKKRSPTAVSPSSTNSNDNNTVPLPSTTVLTPPLEATVNQISTFSHAFGDTSAHSFSTINPKVLYILPPEYTLCGVRDATLDTTSQLSQASSSSSSTKLEAKETSEQNRDHVDPTTTRAETGYGLLLRPSPSPSSSRLEEDSQGPNGKLGLDMVPSNDDFEGDPEIIPAALCYR